jgi:hypothetical protein
MKLSKSHHDASREAEERGDQREDPVYRLEHAIEKQSQNDIERGRDEIRGIAIGSKPAAKKELGGYCRQKVEQIDCTGYPGIWIPHSFFNPFLHS